MWMHWNLQRTQKAKSPSRNLPFTRGIQTENDVITFPYMCQSYVFPLWSSACSGCWGGWDPIWDTWWCARLLYGMWPFPTLCVSPPEEGEYFLKVLIPSYAAGSIIGKGGQTIVQLQKETGATIKLSKSKDFYPGKNGHSVIKIDEHKGLCMYERSRLALYPARGATPRCRRAFHMSSSFGFPWVIAVDFNITAIVNTLIFIIVTSLKD